MLFKDQQGELNLNKLQAKLSLAYHQKVSQYSFMSAGVQFGLTQHSIDGSKAEWHNQFDGVKHDASLPSYEQALFGSFLNFDVGAGVLWRYDTKSKNRFTDNPFSTVNLGVSVYQLVGSGLSYNGGEAEKMKYVAFGNTAFYIKDQIMELEPSFLYQLKGKEQELVLGMLFRRIFVEPSYYTEYYKRFDLAIGAYYRIPNDAIIPAVSMNYDSFGVGVSYDINLSELNQASNYQGGLEIFLKYILR
jgi:type IX secretion system PorP/SprF family membrane protein